MKNVLVTGGAGFIGTNFVRQLLETTDRVKVWVVDALTYAGMEENLDGLGDRLLFRKGDILTEDFRSLILENWIDTIVHFAAESHVDRSIHGPLAFVETNVLGTAKLLEGARQAWLVEKMVHTEAFRFHHVSTDEVYGSLGPDDPAFKETTPYDPSSPYSASKAAADHLVRAYHRTYKLPVTISNCSNNYGPYQHPEKLIPTVILSALEGKKIPIYGDGKQQRDWLYVDDHCRGILAALHWGKVGETYNIGAENERTNLEIVQAICEILDVVHMEGKPHSQLIEHVADRPGHDRRYAVNAKKLFLAGGWHPEIDMRPGLIETVRWYLAHLPWVEACRARGHQEWTKTNYENRGKA